MFFALRRLGRRELSEYQHNRVQSRGAHAAPQGQGPVRPVSVSQGRRKPKRSGGVWRVVFIISLIVFVCAAGALAFIGYGYWHGQQNNKQLEQIGFNAPDAAALQRMDLASFTVDWDALRAINPDVVGWIYVPGTTVNFPIVHGTDDEHYLKTDFYGQTSWVSFGSIFLSELPAHHLLHRALRGRRPFGSNGVRQRAGAPGLRAGQGRPFRRHGGGASLCRRHEAHVRVLHLR